MRDGELEVFGLGVQRLVVDAHAVRSFLGGHDDVVSVGGEDRNDDAHARVELELVLEGFRHVAGDATERDEIEGGARFEVDEPGW